MAEHKISTSSRKSSSSRAKSNLLEMKDTLDQLQILLDKKEEVLQQKIAILQEIGSTTSESAHNTSFASLPATRIDRFMERYETPEKAEIDIKVEEFFQRCEMSESQNPPIPRPRARSSLLKFQAPFSEERDQTFPPKFEFEVKRPMQHEPIRSEAQLAALGATQGDNRNEPRSKSAPQTSTSKNDIDRHETDNITKLAHAIQSAVTGGINNQVFHTKLVKLPQFDGNPKDWLQFKAMYTETTRRYNISPADNLLRLRSALTGDAKLAVSALLHSCTEPLVIMDTLQLRFGHPSRLMRDQINEMKNLKTVSNDPLAISEFSCKVSNCVAVIRGLGLFEYLCSAELYECVISKMNSNLRSRWMDFAAAHDEGGRGELPTLSDFLRREAELALRYLPELPTNRPSMTPVVPGTGAKRYGVHPVLNTNNSKVKSCSFCNESDHNIVICSKFQDLSVPDRMNWVKDNKKCFRCLVYQHPAKNCKISKYLHKLLRKPVEVVAQTKDVQSENKSESAKVNTVSQNIGAMLKVVPLKVIGPKGTCQTFALLDEGASISLVDFGIAKKVGACPIGNSEKLNLQGIGTTCQTIDSVTVNLKIETTHGTQFAVNLRTMREINLQTQLLNKDKILKYSHVQPVEHLIDWYSEASPQLLIGQDHWNLIVSRQLYAGQVNEPVISETLLGHVVHGNINCMRSSILSCHHVSGKIASDEDLHTLVKETFQLDTLGIEAKERSNPLTERAVSILNDHTKKGSDNSWETSLLWAKDDNDFPQTDRYALKRLFSLEKSFSKDDIFAKAYTAQIQRLLDLGYAKLYDDKIDMKESTLNSSQGWVLPHFAVVNPNKPGKVRVVFDCASKVEGRCLNDYFLTGPELLQSLLGVLWRFRQREVAIASDIKDMFLKIKIRKEDQKYQKFYWREPGDSEDPKLYVMMSMLFGAKCSPSSAIFVKNRNAQEFQDVHPEAVKAIEANFYCDDYLDSCSTQEQAVEMAANIIKIHERGNFDICNWASNSLTVMQSIPENKRGAGNVKIGWEESKERTLGMIWTMSSDTLSYNLSMNRVPKEVASGQTRPTQRQMLAVIASIFDPIGLLSHFTVRGKIILQDTWRSGITWDQPLKDSEYYKWQAWLEDLQTIKDCAIPRCYAPNPDNASIQLHTFCDASSKAYAAACYLRYTYEDGTVKTALVTAKALVTSLKPCSIPRLELQAALLGARLADSVIKEHQLNIKEKYYWSDSGTTLAWIRSDPRSYKAFVSHRLAAIDDLTEVSQWRWVPTEFNSADIATRDTTKLVMSLESPWFSGPSFLKLKEEKWPVEKKKMIPAVEATCEEKEKEVKIHVITQKEYSLPDVTAFSSWKRLIRATAYVFIFINRCKKNGETTLTVKMLEQAEKLWIKKAQADDFNKEICCLKEKKDLPTDSKLLTLTPLLDEDGIMRLCGRINRIPDVSTEVKRPVILNGSHPYTKLLLYNFHKLHNHSSTETVVNEVRQRYWVLKMRSTIRSVAHNCQHCKIKRAKAVQPHMGDLPIARLQHHQRPFSFCGLDYFGPVEVAIGRRREKRWGALFTCMVTRAVHMEVAGSLTADSVIMAIRRMAARRGWPTAIHSDNGTNFKGADKELKKAFAELDKNAIADEMLSKGIEWHYIPANAPHMGGAWERLVQAIKKALAATLHERAPREEVLATLITEAEHSVNSRPLTFVSVDPNDSEALTPNHFLISTSSGMPVPGSFDDKDLLLRKQWKAAQRLADIFWSRWIKEYLPTLLDRKMKNTSDQIIKEGHPVIIMDHTMPRNVWQRGIITKTFPGDDGKIRVVEVKTSGGSLRRPVNKIIILPVESNIASVNCLCDVMSRLSETEARDKEGRSDNPPRDNVGHFPT